MKSHEFTQNTIEAAIRLGLLLILATWCFNIIQPFIIMVMWAAIIAVAVYPFFRKLESALGGKTRLATLVYILLALALLIIPTIMISDSIIDTSQHLNQRYESGELKLPVPDEAVKEWPLVGEKLYTFWSEASTNPEDTLIKYQQSLKDFGRIIVSIAAGAGSGIIQTIIAIIISAVLLANATAAYSITTRLFSRLIGADKGNAYANLSRDTIRSVAQGVLGVAIIQAVLSALGMMVMNVPGWGLWTLLILVLAIAQLPTIIVLGVVIFYVFSVADTAPAVIFCIYSLIVGASDSFLKPMFLGRGMETPMLIILLGAIGGLIMSGILGLFVGAIVLALGYELFMAWLNTEEDAVQQESIAEKSVS